MTVINHKNISGVTSITTPAGSDNLFTVHTNDTTERFRIDASGHQNISGIITAANFKTGTSNLHSTGLNIQDLDVDGHTNLDNVSIAGVSTFTDNVTIVKTSGPLLELTTNTGAADATLRLSEGATGSTTNGGGMYYSGADNKLYITCGTNSTTKRITIKRDDGKVGINSTTPGDLLTIGVGANTLAFGAKDTTRGNHIWQLLNNDNSGNAEFRMYKNSVTGTHAQSINFATSGDANYILDGNFGIGTNNPSDIDSIGKSLNIASSTGGAIYLQDTDAPTAKFAAISYNGSTAALQIHAHHSSSYIDLGTNGTSRVRIDSSGRLFVNRTAQHASSSERLSVNGMTSIQNNSTSTASLYIFNEETTTSGNPIQPFLFCHDGGGIRAALGVQRSTGKTILNGQFGLSFRTGTSALGGTERLFITSAGDMGLGCDNPGADPAIGNDATVFEIRQTTSGNITSGNNRKGAVLRLKHEAQWENGYQSSSPNDDLGRVEFVTGDSSVGEGVRSAIRCRNLQYYNKQALTFEVATANSTSLEERLRIDSAGRLLYGKTSSTLETSLVLCGNSNSYTTNPGVLQLEMGNTPSNLGSLGQITFGSQDKVGARIDGRANQDWTLNSARGTHIRLLTVANGSTSLTERLRITSEGKVVMMSQGASLSDGYAALEIRQNKGGKHLILGTNSPTASDNEVMLGFKLHPSGQDERVKGAIICRGTGTGDYGNVSRMSFCVDSGSNNNNATISSNEIMRITSSAVTINGSTDGILNLDTTDSRGSFIRFQQGTNTRCWVGSAQGMSMGDDEDLGLMASDKIRFKSSGSERMIIDANELRHGHSNVIGGSFDSVRINNGASYRGFVLRGTGGSGGIANYDEYCWLYNRMGSDGMIVAFNAQGSQEGSINVSGSSVSYNGGVLTRWSQLVGISTNVKSDRPTIYQGTVMSNLDEMCEWTGEENMQLNKTQVSTASGDRNVAGVFWSWDDDDDTYTNDFYIAQTGDFIVRVAGSTTVTRGDLLESAGDGTAKPQSDDIVRSKTVGKITSGIAHTTYADGSKAYPCVLMTS